MQIADKYNKEQDMIATGVMPKKESEDIGQVTVIKEKLRKNQSHVDIERKIQRERSRINKLNNGFASQKELR